MIYHIAPPPPVLCHAEERRGREAKCSSQEVGGGLPQTTVSRYGALPFYVSLPSGVNGTNKVVPALFLSKRQTANATTSNLFVEFTGPCSPCSPCSVWVLAFWDKTRSRNPFSKSSYTHAHGTRARVLRQLLVIQSSSCSLSQSASASASY